MLDLDSERWRSLSHAYGSARDVPEMLRDLSRKPTDKAWDRLWAAVCHQSTVYTSSFAVVPHLVALAESRPPKEQVMFWVFVGTVAAHARTKAPEDLRGDYEEANARAATLIHGLLKTRPAAELDTTYLIQALAAVRGCRGPGRVLDNLVNGDFFAACPKCEAELEAAVSADGILLKSGEERVWVESAPGKPPKQEAWLLEVAQEAGHPALARSIGQLYWEVPCPGCREKFPLMDGLQVNC